MFKMGSPSLQRINYTSYRDKVLGCWTGKNIGGTLGAPFEWDRNVNQATFYTQELNGKPLPNDDLDLQLIWLIAAEENGVYHLNERLLGEYWLNYITGPWSEYGVCKANMRNGLYPPLSGSCNNDRWKFSNGAWIRSEIWACLFPGAPDEAVEFAYMDACCDHCGEGIYAEIFITAMESAAFLVSDIRRLIEIGLSKIPVDCRIARSVKLVCDHYDHGDDFLTTREAVVKDNEDLGWFQAPGNIGFVIIGLLYGQGDFSRTVCLANNCGDDADCTAGSVGALLGIILGRSGIPTKWTDPIGESIQTCSIVTYNNVGCLSLPQTLDELTERAAKLAISAQWENPKIPQFTADKSVITATYLDGLCNSKVVAERIWPRSPFELTFDLGFVKFMVNYEGGPEVALGEPKKLMLRLQDVRTQEQVASVKISAPADWQVLPGPEAILSVKNSDTAQLPITVIPGGFTGAYYYLPVEIRLCDRFHPTVVYVPLQRRGCVNHDTSIERKSFYDAIERRRCRYMVPIKVS